MVSLTKVLPQVSKSTAGYVNRYDHSNDPWFRNLYGNAQPKDSQDSTKSKKPVPPYTRRSGFRPSKPEDFGDGGAFPEIHYAQYPLDMGRRTNQNPGTRTLPVTVDEYGNVRFDAIVKQDENAKKIVYSKHSDLVPIFVKDNVKEAVKDEAEKQKEIEETTKETKAALEKIVNAKLSVAQPKKVRTQSSEPQYVKYATSQQSSAFNSGAKQRIVQIAEMPVDPLEPAKFKHKKVPRGRNSPPVPVLSSPPRVPTRQERQDWNIVPPCISNWKNPKGYTIPLDKRLAADGRGLTDVTISEKRVFLAEALYLAEERCREQIELRNKVQREMNQKEKERKENELKELARKARSDRSSFAHNDNGMELDQQKETNEERAERLKREEIRGERRKDRERERRMEAKDAPLSKKSKISRDKERDISEKVALGMANVKGGGGEVMYDQRLFNQEKGMNSGFMNDDNYNIYDNRLFNAQSTLNTLYRPKTDRDDELYGGSSEQQLDKLMKTDRFKPDRAFSGTSKTGLRDGPVEFEKNVKTEEEKDPFGLDKFLAEVKTGKEALEKVGNGGTLKATAGSMRDGFEGSSRSLVNFTNSSLKATSGSRRDGFTNKKFGRRSKILL